MNECYTSVTHAPGCNLTCNTGVTSAVIMLKGYGIQAIYCALLLIHLQVVQLQELFAVRHSVFIIGNAGTGKSQVWKTLYRTYYNQKRKPFYNDLEPKAVTNDELFGIINPATREWRDGNITSFYILSKATVLSSISKMCLFRF